MPTLLRIALLVLGALPRPVLAGATVLCTLVVEAATGAAMIDEGDCATRWSPAWTVKVALALMGFDAGILTAPPDVPPSYRARDSVLTGVFGPGGPLD